MVEVVDISAAATVAAEVAAANMHGPLNVSVRGTKSVTVVSPFELHTKESLPGPPVRTFIPGPPDSSSFPSPPSITSSPSSPRRTSLPGPTQFGLNIATVPQASQINFGIPILLSPFTSLQDILFIGATEFQFSIRIDESTLPPTPPGLTLDLDTDTCSGTVDTTQSQDCDFTSRYIPIQSPQG